MNNQWFNKNLLKTVPIKKIIITVGSVFIFIGLLEIFISIIKNEKKYFSSTKEIYHKDEVKFNSEILLKYYTNLTSLPYNYSTSFKSKKSENSYRVFLLGESPVSGWPYSPKQSVQSKVKSIIDRNVSNNNVELITISFAGFNSSCAYDIIRQIIQFKPDLIILYVGHNEFYGYNGYSFIRSEPKINFIGLVENILNNAGLTDSFKYDNQNDDLEVILPVNSGKQIIPKYQHEYNVIKEQFYSNINNIVSVCKENKINLVLTALSDNCFIPPIGVLSAHYMESADIIYNNARMELLRDGNSESAFKLFTKSKDADAFRLRIPDEFMEYIKKISLLYGITYADIKKEFQRNSISEIPGNNLFLDYTHPNSKGLDIIASIYADIVINNVTDKPNQRKGINPFKYTSSISLCDSILATKRVDKSRALIKYNERSIE